VVEVGSEVLFLRPGDRVVVDPIQVCRKCRFCQQGLPNLCERGGLRGRETDGLCSEYAVAPEGRSFKFGEDISFEEGTIFICLYTVVYGQRRVPYVAGSKVVVLGMGLSGLLNAQLAKQSKAELVIGVSRSQWKLDLALRLGVDTAINALEVDPVEAVLGQTEGLGADLVIESAGSPETIRQSLEMVKPGGTVLQFGIGPKRVDELDMSTLYFKNIKVMGTRAGTPEDYRTSIKLVEARHIDLKPLITHRYPLEQIQEGFQDVYGGANQIMRAVINI
ncbi:MAG: zinc-binding dehydrogenase, partial [Nitrospinota bacterium]